MFSSENARGDIYIFFFSWAEGFVQSNFVNLTPIYKFQSLQAYSYQWKTPTGTWLYLHTHSDGHSNAGPHLRVLLL